MVALCGSCERGLAPFPVDPDDLDGDGVPNEADVCPHAPDPLQHDEDGDGFGDACDVCPTVYDPLQLDRGERDAMAFEDGVGDACDPRPTRGGERLAALHTFASPSTAGWIGEGWTIGEDRARAAGDARWQHRRHEQGDGLAARLQVAALTWVTEGARVSVALDGDGLEAGRLCTLYADRDEDGSDELEVEELGGGVKTLELGAAAVAPLELVIIRGVERAGTGKILCQLREATGAPRKVELQTFDNLTSGQYVFAVRAAAVEVSSLVVYTSPIACPPSLQACPRPPDPTSAAPEDAGP